MIDWFLNAIKPVEKISFADFCEQEIVLPEGNAQGELMRFLPWQRAILPHMEKYHEAAIAACPRSGKSLYGLCRAMYRLCVWADSVVILAPEQKLVEEFFRDKVLPIFNANPRLYKLLPAGFKDKETVGHYLRLQNGGVLRLVYSARSGRSYSARTIFVTEASLVRGTKDETDAITHIKTRSAEFDEKYFIMESTHTRPDTPFAKGISRGTDSRILCRCTCGSDFEAGEESTIEIIDGALAIRCPICSRIYTEADRARLLSSLTVKHAKPEAATFSITVNWLHTNLSFAEVQERYEAYKSEKNTETLRAWKQNCQAQTVSLEEEIPETVSAFQITRDTFLQRTHTHVRETVPMEAVLTTGAIDCQKHWLYGLALSIGRDLSIYWVDWFVAHILTGDEQEANKEAAEDDKIVATPDRVIGALTTAHARLCRYSPAMIAVDVGYKSEASHLPIISAWANSMPNVAAIRGRTDSQFAGMAKHTKIALPQEVAPLLDPRPQATGGLMWFLNVDQIKNQLAAAIMRPPGAQASCYFPADVDKSKSASFFQHMTAEEPVMKRGRYGETLTWQPKYGHTGRNDWWDCSVYAFAFALLQYHIQGWHLKKEKKEAPPAGPGGEKKRPVRKAYRSTGYAF